MMNFRRFILGAIAFIASGTLAFATITDANNNPINVTGAVATFTGLNVNGGSTTPSITLVSVPSSAAPSSTVPITFSFTTATPTGLTASWAPGAIVGTVTGFSSSGTATISTPSTANTYTLTITGTGPNTASSTALNTTIVSAPGSAFPGQPGNPVGYQAYGSGVLGTTPYPGGAFVNGTAGAHQVYANFVFTGGTNINCNFCDFIQDDFKPGTSTMSVSGSNIGIYGSRIQSNATGQAAPAIAVNVSGGNILFSYDSLVPMATFFASPPGSVWPSAGSGTNSSAFNSGVNSVPGAQAYHSGITMAAGISGPVTIDHLNAWGYGQDGVEWSGTSTQQVNVTNSWIHDAASPDAIGYHTDGIGYMNGGGGPSNILAQGNTIVSLGNSNAIAFQAATSGYANIQVIGNYVGGTGETIGMCSPGSTPCSGTSTFKDNVYGTDVKPVFQPIHGNNGAGWKCNTINFRPGTTWSAGITPTAANQGQYLLPNGTISPTDNGGNTTCP